MACTFIASASCISPPAPASRSWSILNISGVKIYLPILAKFEGAFSKEGLVALVADFLYSITTT